MAETTVRPRATQRTLVAAKWTSDDPKPLAAVQELCEALAIQPKLGDDDNPNHTPGSAWRTWGPQK